MVSTSLMVDTSSHPRAQLHRCVERSAYEYRIRHELLAWSREGDEAAEHHKADAV